MALIILQLRSKSERVFYQLLEKSRHINLKLFYKKIAAQRVRDIIKFLEKIQKTLNIIIFERKAEFCKINGLPITSLELKAEVKVDEENDLVYLEY